MVLLFFYCWSTEKKPHSDMKKRRMVELEMRVPSFYSPADSMYSVFLSLWIINKQSKVAQPIFRQVQCSC